MSSDTYYEPVHFGQSLDDATATTADCETKYDPNCLQPESSPPDSVGTLSNSSTISGRFDGAAYATNNGLPTAYISNDNTTIVSPARPPAAYMSSDGSFVRFFALSLENRKKFFSISDVWTWSSKLIVNLSSFTFMLMCRHICIFHCFFFFVMFHFAQTIQLCSRGSQLQAHWEVMVTTTTAPFSTAPQCQPDNVIGTKSNFEFIFHTYRTILFFIFWKKTSFFSVSISRWSSSVVVSSRTCFYRYQRWLIINSLCMFGWKSLLIMNLFF